MGLSLLRQNSATLATFIGIYNEPSTSTLCRKGASSEIMLMKSSKLKKVEVSVTSDSIPTEQATTSSDILSVGQLFSW